MRRVRRWLLYTVIVSLLLVFAVGLACSQPEASAAGIEVATGDLPYPLGYFAPDAEGKTFTTATSGFRATLDSLGVHVATDTYSVEIDFGGAALGAGPAGAASSGATLNVVAGSDPSRWRQDVPLYNEVIYRALYPGTDLVFTHQLGRLKSAFTLQPGADPGLIHISYAGALLSVQDAGKALSIELANGTVLHEAIPSSYQLIDEQQLPVDVTFALLDAHTYTFRVAGMLDPDAKLVIDPELTYGTYLGGSSVDEGWSICVDHQNNTYISGITQSDDFPLASPGDGRYDKDVFAAKYNASGALVYVTIVGGISGEEGNAIAVDGSGNAYVAGETFSPDFPLLNAWQPYFAGYEDAFVLKLDPAGKLAYSTYFGGARGEEVDDMVADSVGNVYLAGEVYSDDFPLMTPWSSTTYGPGEEDAFITIFNALGEMVYSTLVGAPLRDQAFRLAVDGEGNVYGTGMTSSAAFPTVNAFQTGYGGDWDDCFVFKLDPWTNTMVYSTFLGGSGRDECWGIAVDDDGAAYVAGYTLSPNFPLADPLQGVPGGQEDAFVAKISPSGSQLLYSTYWGGNGRDWAWDLDLDDGGNIYVTGETASTNFPTYRALQPTLKGDSDAFVVVLDPDLTLQYASYLGGTDYDRGWRMAVDEHRIVHITGETASVDFPVVAGQQMALAGQKDGFLTRFGLIPTPTPTPTPTPFAAAQIGPEGGSVWMNYPGHLTLLTVPSGYVDVSTAFTLTYDGRTNTQGELQGIDHFFVLTSDAAPGLERPLPGPLQVLLGYNFTAPVIPGTLDFYRLSSGAWTTDTTTVTAAYPTYLRADIEMTGVYGLLGRTNRTYIPIVLRQ